MDLQYRTLRIMGLRATIATCLTKGYVTGEAGCHQVIIDVIEDYEECSSKTISLAQKEIERRLRDAIQRERDERAAQYHRR